MRTITLSGPVGDQHFNIRLLDGLATDPLKIIIDSGGGCSITAFAIYRQLIEHPGNIEVEIHKAGSAATLVSMAGDRRTIRGDGHFFIHRSWGCVIGTAPTLREALKLQEEWDAAIAEIYAERASLPLKQVYRLMDDETTLSPIEALKLGFVNEVLGEPHAVVHFTTPERTALACIDHEHRTSTPFGKKRQNEARPVALLDPRAGPVLNRPGTPLPDIPREKAAEALASFIENQRREAAILHRLRGRLYRAICHHQHVQWPYVSTWTCGNCQKINHGPPGKDRFANPCAECGATFDKEEILI